MNKALQAKHLDEATVLRLIAEHTVDNYATASSFDLARVLDLPWKVVNAKLAAMKRRGFVDGCSCGCSGGWRLTDAGREKVGK